MNRKKEYLDLNRKSGDLQLNGQTLKDLEFKFNFAMNRVLVNVLEWTIEDLGTELRNGVAPHFAEDINMDIEALETAIDMDLGLHRESVDKIFEEAIKQLGFIK